MTNDQSHTLSSFPHIPFPSARESTLYLTTNTNCPSLQKATFEKRLLFCRFISYRTKFSQIFFEDLFPSKKVQNATSSAPGKPSSVRHCRQQISALTLKEEQHQERRAVFWNEFFEKTSGFSLDYKKISLKATPFWEKHS